MHPIWSALGIVAIASASPTGSHWQVGQEVSTSSGKFTGHASKWQPQVSEYLGIPFAKPPLDELRFAPPQPLKSSKGSKADKWGAECMQPDGAGIVIQNETPGISHFMLGMGNPTPEDPRPMSEDCLTLNVWTKPQTGEKKKAVFVWFYGGAYTIGTTNAPFYNGARLVNEEDIIVVNVNYRVNIFGFSRAPGMPNAGLLDQRQAVEWVRDNIAAFGGDHQRITIGGMSAGAFSADTHAFAFIDPPIINGIIAQSGSALTGMNLAAKPDKAEKDWFKATEMANCSGGKAAGSNVVDCMRKVSADELKKVVTKMAGANMLGPFQPVIDEKTMFSDTRARGLAGKFVRKPLLIGVNNDEFGLERAMPGVFGPLVAAFLKSGIPANEAYTVSEAVAFTCASGASALARSKNNVPVWRYRFMPAFPDMILRPGIGAYHGIELPTVFGSDSLAKGASPTDEQEKLSAEVRHAWASFIKDPANGLTALKWPKYDPAGQTLIKLGVNNSSKIEFGPSTEYDTMCAGLDSIDNTLGLIPV